MTLPILYADPTAPLAPYVNGLQGPGPDDRLTLVVRRTDGTEIRWAEDELLAANIPLDLSFGTSMPGGFKGLQTSLLRAIGSVSREGLFDDVLVLGLGGEIVWEGRLQQMPVSTEQGGRVTPQAVGWVAHLDDDATVREVYVDRDLSSWAGRPQMRIYSLLTFGVFKPADASTGWSSADGVTPGPSIDLNIAGYAWSSNNGRPDVGLTYDAGGIPIGAVEYRWFAPLLLSVGWQQNLEGFGSADGDDAIGSLMTTGNNIAAGNKVTLTMPTGVRRVDASLRYAQAPAGDGNSTWGVQLVEVAVYGRHGLTGTRGRSYTGAGQGPLGFAASDVIADASRRWAPLLRYSTGTGGSITPTTYPIPHLTFDDPTTVADVVQRANAYHQWDWAVWEGRTLAFGPRGGGRTWRISTADGLDLSLEGETTDAIYNGVLVQYFDFAGVQRTVGPPGSVAEATDARLEVTDATNAATSHGIRRRSVLPLSTATDREGATIIGQAWLRAQASGTRRGSATVYGWVTDDQGTMRPVSRIRAGDTLVVEDRPDDPPRRIVETSYSHTARTNTLTLDNSAATLEAILERLSVALVGAL